MKPLVHLSDQYFRFRGWGRKILLRIPLLLSLGIPNQFSRNTSQDKQLVYSHLGFAIIICYLVEVLHFVSWDIQEPKTSQGSNSDKLKLQSKYLQQVAHSCSQGPFRFLSLLWFKWTTIFGFWMICQISFDDFSVGWYKRSRYAIMKKKLMLWNTLGLELTSSCFPCLQGETDFMGRQKW